MKNVTGALVLGLGCAVVAIVPIATASAQSQPKDQAQSEPGGERQYDRSGKEGRDRYDDERYERGYAQRYDDDRDQRRYSDDRDGYKRGWRRRRAAGYRGRHRGQRFLSRYDLNKDGNITQVEFAEAMMKRFKQIDANSDGTITVKEIAQRKHRRRSY